MSHQPACWDKADALKILPTEALSGSDAIFLATHVPMRDLEVLKEETPLGQDPDDEALFAALETAGSHVLCVIGGEPGSGKSHLIRWLGVKWNTDRREGDLVVMVPRADGSLHGTLRTLCDQLPKEFRSRFSGLKPAQDIADQGRRRNFQAKLANSTLRGHFVKDPEDTQWCEQNGIAAILGHELVQKTWQAPGRIMRIVSGRGEGGEERLSAVAEFGLPDVLELVGLQRKMARLAPTPRRFLRKLEKEQKLILAVPEEERTTEGLAETLQDQVPQTLKLLAALNARLNHAVQELIGMTSEDLERLFQDLREAIGSKGRLILLLEDITNFQGVDDKLIDVLVERSDTGDKTRPKPLCDLISIVGITPRYHKRYASNYEQRFTHHVRLGESEAADGFRTSRALSEPEGLTRFVAAYLKAIRAGVERVEATSGTGLYNRCTLCERRPACHSTFGESGDVGLFPFTRAALTRIYAQSIDPDGRMTLQTPRGVIHNVLNPTMRAPEALDAGRYPGGEVETLYLPKGQRGLQGALEDHVEAEALEEDRERMRRLLVWWGSRTSMVTERDSAGNLEFAGVPKGVFEAFGLPWIGQERRGVPNETPPPPTQEGTAKPLVPPQIAPKPPTKTPKPAKPSKARPWDGLGAAQLEIRRAEIREWADGDKELRGPDFWDAVFERGLMNSVRWNGLGVSPFFRQKLFSRDRTVFDDTRKRRGYSFVLRRSRWLADGLASFLVLRASDPDEGLDYHRYRLAKALRRLEGVIERHASALLPRSAEHGWSPLVGAAQAGLVHAWLRGDLAPTASDQEQWLALFGVAGEPTTEPKRRVDSWLKMLDGARALRAILNAEMRHLVDRPGDIAASLAWADPSDALRGIRLLRESLRPLEPPAKADFVAASIPLLDLLHRVLSRTAKLPRMLDAEEARLRRSIELIDRTASGLALRSFLDRAANAAVATVQLSPSAPAKPVTDLTAAIRALTDKLDAKAIDRLRAELPAADDNEDDDVYDDDDDDDQSDLPLSPAERFAWCAAAPAGDLERSGEAVKAAKEALQTLTDHVDALAGAGTASLTTIKGQGETLATAAGSLVGALK